MTRQSKYVQLIILLISIEILLIVSVPVLESRKFPLLGSVMCIQTQSSNDLYWSINQVELYKCSSIDNVEGRVRISMIHNVPNYASFLFRANNAAEWMRTSNVHIDLKLREGENIFEVKAKNMFGVETTAVKYRIIKTDDVFKVTPKDERIIKGKYDFRFEPHDSPKIEWLRNHTLPVVAKYRNQWDKYIAL